MASPMRACTSEMILSISGPSSVRYLIAQHDGQRHHHVTVGHQQITRCDIAVRDERLDCLLTAADQQGQLARLSEVAARWRV
jgi:hypothetical protein